MDQNIIIPIFGMLTGIIIPIAVFVWLYKDAKGKRETVLEISKNFIKWSLIPGEINNIEFYFWIWNKLLLGFLLIALIILMAYFVRFYKYKIGSNFPELPSN